MSETEKSALTSDYINMLCPDNQNGWLGVKKQCPTYLTFHQPDYEQKWQWGELENANENAIHNNQQKTN